MPTLNKCANCGKYPLNKDEIAASKRFLGEKMNVFLCLDCLAADIGYDREELDAMISQLKEDGCQYFS